MTALQISTYLEVKAAKCKALITVIWSNIFICKCTTIKQFGSRLFFFKEMYTFTQEECFKLTFIIVFCAFLKSA